MITANNVGKFTLGEEKKKASYGVKGCVTTVTTRGQHEPTV